jgi:hypothetical protein
VTARLRGVDAAVGGLGGLGGSGEEEAEAAELLQSALEGCPGEGRPLFEANLALEWPEEPHLALWHAATLVREHRGDGHLAALRRAGLDACEAHVTQVAASGVGLETIKPYRGWSDVDWSEAAERLRRRGWLEEDGALTSEGARVRAQVEDETDAGGAVVVERLGTDADRLFALLGDVVGRLLATGVIPYPNPMGVPTPEVGTAGR